MQLLKDFGVIPSSTDIRDFTPRGLGLKLDETSPEDNLEIVYHNDPKTQSNNTCLSNTISEYKECDHYDKTGVFEEFSPGFIYANRLPTDYQGAGMQTRETLNHLIKEGACLQKDFPYDLEYPEILEKFNPLKEELFVKAAEHKSTSYLALDKENIEEIKAFLWKYKKPTIVCIKIYQSWYSTDRATGIVPPPSGGVECRHALLCLGYKKSVVDGITRLKVLNTKGKRWGADGYGYIPISYLTEAWGILDNDLYL